MIHQLLYLDCLNLCHDYSFNINREFSSFYYAADRMAFANERHGKPLKAAINSRLTSLLFVSKIMIGFPSCKIHKLKFIQSMSGFRVLEKRGILQVDVTSDHDDMGIASKIHIGVVHRRSSFHGNDFSSN